MLSKGGYWIVINGQIVMAHKVLRAEPHVALKTYRNLENYKNKKITGSGLIV